MTLQFDADDRHSERVLSTDFYAQKPHELACALLGRDLVIQREPGDYRRGRIVETEVYGFVPDRASHSYRGVKTPRNQAMFGAPGEAYIYLIYGVYHCFNVVSLRGERPSAILIRALRPLDGLPAMARARGLRAPEGVGPSEAVSRREQKKLLSGPGKICQALQIDREFDEHPLWMAPLTIREGVPRSVRDGLEIVSGPRIGLNPNTVGECTEWAWRYGVQGSKFLSRPFK